MKMNEIKEYIVSACETRQGLHMIKTNDKQKT